MGRKTGFSNVALLAIFYNIFINKNVARIFAVINKIQIKKIFSMEKFKVLNNSPYPPFIDYCGGEKG